MDDYVRYEEFFNDDEEAENREDTKDTKEKLYFQRKATERQTHQRTVRGEGKSDLGCLVWVLLYTIWFFYIVIKIATG